MALSVSHELDQAVTPMLDATLTLAQADHDVWDAVVVGAGPSGSMAARALAQRGATVLLVEKAAFPRRKVCGGFINAVARHTLGVAALGHVLTRLGAPMVSELVLCAGRWRATIPLPPAMAVSREAFDTALATEAIRAGAQFLPRTVARLDGVDARTRSVRLCGGQEQRVVRARLVLAADGLAGTLVESEPRLHRIRSSRSRIGVGTIAPEAPMCYRPGATFIASGAGGYVGLVRLEDGRLDIAAAIDPARLQQAGGTINTVRALMQDADLPPINGLEQLSWHGIPGLTHRRSTLAAHRLLVLGDSAGYIEPFTGEGIAWALASGLAVVPVAVEAIRRWSPGLMTRWTVQHRRLFCGRQRTCWLITQLLRRPRLTRAGVALLSHASWLARPVVSTIHHPFSLAHPAIDS